MSDATTFLLAHRRRVAGGGATALLGVGLLFAGCQGDDLTGTVANKDGKPVSWGTVTAVGSDNRVYSAPIQLDGSYRLSGLPRGTPVRISVSSPNPTPSSAPPAPVVRPAPPADGTRPPPLKAEKRPTYGVEATLPPPNTPVPQNVPAPGQWYPIDGKYANPGTSGLSATPGGGKHDITVD